MRVVCDRGFTVKSANEDELASVVQTHAKGQHDTDTSREDVFQRAKPV